MVRNTNKAAEPEKENQEPDEKAATEEVISENAEDSDVNDTVAGEEPAAEEEEEKTPAEVISELQDKYLRLSADFDNFRKRSLREKMELIKLANEELLLQILPVMDDFERALRLMNDITDCASMKEGIDLIFSKFRDFLIQNGIKEIEAMNAKFDTDLHEAVTKIPVTSKKMKGKVVDVIEKGYILHDKVIRYSKVVVGDQ